MRGDSVVAAPDGVRAAAVPVVSALGPLQARLDGVRLDLGGPRQRAVLARLVMAAGQVVSTDRLLDDLWDGEPPPKALAGLQVHVSHLRRVLEPDRARRAPASVLVSAAPGYALHLPSDAVDVWRFEHLLHEAAEQAARPDEVRALTTQALRCWSGDAYAEFADASWAVPEISRLHELRCSAVERRAAADLACGDPARAVPDLERHVAEHPLREEALRLLALALYQAGRQADALSLLRAARRRLSDELGVDPGPALRALEADVLAHAPSLAPPPRSVTPGVARPPTALPVQRSAAIAGSGPAADPAEPVSAIGRADELGALRDAADHARTGARVAWVGGEAGAGKTTVAQALAERLRPAGWRVVWGRCPEVDGSPPGWAWTEVAAALVALAPPEPPLTGPLVQLLEPSAVVGDAAVAPFWLARAVADLVRAVVAEAPLLVVLDDLHRADDVTLQLLRQVAADLTGLPVLLLATLRPSESGDGLEATSAALAGTTAARLDLPGLGRQGVAALARESGLPDVDDATVDLLTTRTGGNPLFVRELARLLAAEGRLSGEKSVPAAVRDVLRRRLARLPAAAQSVLRRAAVLGREVDVDALVELCGGDDEDVLTALELAVVSGLLVEPAPGLVRFAHALVRDTLYEDMPLLRRVRLHASALRVTERRAPEDLAALAHHASAGATPTTAGHALGHVTAAARRAERLGAHGEAARLWADALRLHELSGERDDAQLLDVLSALVATRARTGDVRGARDARRRALDVAHLAEDRAGVQRALASWDAPVIYSVRQDRLVDEALTGALRGALATPGLPDDVRVRLLVSLVFEVEGVDDQLAASASGEALALARQSEDARVLCAALGARLFLSLGPDLAEEREPLAQELLAVASAAGHDDHATLAHFHLFLLSAARADLAGARRCADHALERAAAGQLGLVLAALTVFSAVLAVLAGRLSEAQAVYAAVASRLAEQGATNGADLRVIGRLVVGFAAGDLADLVPDVVALHERMPGDLHEPLVLALLDAGRRDAARAHWRPEVPVRRDYYWLAMTTLRAHAAVRLGDRDTARRCYDDLSPYAGSLAGIDAGSVVFGSVDSALASLATLLEQPGAAAGHAAAARALDEQVARALAELG